MFDVHAVGCGVGDVALQVGFAPIHVGRCAATARDNVIHAIDAGRIRVVLDPVIQQVIVASEGHPHVMLPEERQIERSHRQRRRFDDG